MIVSSQAASQVVSLLDYRRAKAVTDPAAPVPVPLPFGRPPQPMTARQARHRERMLGHLASLAGRTTVARPDDTGR